MFQRIVVVVVCLGLLGSGALMLSASPAGRNIFHQASGEGSCAMPCPATQDPAKQDPAKQDPAKQDPKSSSSAGFMIAGTPAHDTFDSDMSGVCQRACAVQQEYDANQVVAQPGAETGDLTQCPVSGVVFAVANDRPAVTVGDDLYRLCCDGCAEKFRVDPARFVQL